MEKPRWQLDLERFLPLKSQFVLSDNVRDLQSVGIEDGAALLPMNMALAQALRARNYDAVLFYDPVRGFRTEALDAEDRTHEIELMQTLGLTPADGVASAGAELLAQTLDRIVTHESVRTAVVVDYASRLTVRSDTLNREEHQLFSRALLLSHRAQPRPGRGNVGYYNVIIWIVERIADLPDWLVVDNPVIRHIPVARPDNLVRRSVAPMLVDSLPGGAELTTDHREGALSEFVDSTEGMLLQDMAAIVQLARAEQVPAREIGEAVRRYKIGVADNPWARIDRARIRNGAAAIGRRVKGQAHAVTHMMDLVKRAVTGVGGGRQGGRPRGVVFLAGPTGVGKTELAKTLTELLFGDTSAYIRFDMSEFSAEHADQRLIGAPPGYVGYDAGGELTNAIRERPFSLVLFDEIEKAHPRILDKFLQVLDDGVLTSGRGERVYFSEAFIVFTSNLGIYRFDQATGRRVPNVTESDDFQVVEARVREEIEDHFKLALNRPEILNRIGENIVVFDFIRPEVAEEIFEAMLESTLEDLAETEIVIGMDAEVRAALRSRCIEDLSHGGRGIRNQLEALFINPLARALFDTDAGPGARFDVRGFASEPVPTVRLAPSRNDTER